MQAVRGACCCEYAADKRTNQKKGPTKGGAFLLPQKLSGQARDAADGVWFWPSTPSPRREHSPH